MASIESLKIETLDKRNDINIYHTRLIFKFIIRFMGFTLGPTNLMVDLKLDWMKMCKTIYVYWFLMDNYPPVFNKIGSSYFMVKFCLTY
jgi:hypothetical protein